MNRTTEDIRDNMDYVGCDNQTALEMCDEIDRLTSILTEIERLASEHCDPDADVTDQSPEDMHAFRNGLIVQLCRKARTP